MQVLGLIAVAAAIPLGLALENLRAEVGILAVGGGLFLLGRWLQKR